MMNSFKSLKEFHFVLSEIIFIVLIEVIISVVRENIIRTQTIGNLISEKLFEDVGQIASSWPSSWPNTALQFHFNFLYLVEKNLICFC